MVIIDVESHFGVISAKFIIITCFFLDLDGLHWKNGCIEQNAVFDHTAAISAFGKA